MVRICALHMPVCTPGEFQHARLHAARLTQHLCTRASPLATLRRYPRIASGLDALIYFYIESTTHMLDLEPEELVDENPFFNFMVRVDVQPSLLLTLR